jgi:hypothetical protein
MEQQQGTGIEFHLEFVATHDPSALDVCTAGRGAGANTLGRRYVNSGRWYVRRFGNIAGQVLEGTLSKYALNHPLCRATIMSTDMMAMTVKIAKTMSTSTPIVSSMGPK